MMTRQSNRLKSFITNLWQMGARGFWLSQGSLGLLILALFVMRWWPGDWLLPVRLLNYFSGWVLVFLLIPLTLAIVAGRQGLAALFAVPTLGLMVLLSPNFVPTPAPAVAATQPLKVMSYNILYRNRNPDTIALIQAEQADIVILQEVVPAMLYAFESRLPEVYPDGQLYFAYEPAIAQLVVSRYPVQSLGGFYALGRTQKTVVEPPHGPIQVWNTHTRTAISQSGWQEQHDHLLALSEAARQVEGPLIITGDFNTTPQADNYRLMTRYLTNAHEQMGYGLEFTYPVQGARLRNYLLDVQWKLLKYRSLRKTLKWLELPRRPLLLRYKYIPLSSGPVVRIDHIFYNAHFRASNAYTLADAGGSDHRPVVATLWLKPQPSAE